MAESDVKSILLLNIFQSAAESAPVEIQEASMSERVWPDKRRPFASPRVTASCAWSIKLLTWDWRVETDPAIVATVPERDTIVLVLVVTLPESVSISLVFWATLRLVASRDPERLARVLASVSTVPESEERVPERVRSLPESEKISEEF